MKIPYQKQISQYINRLTKKGVSILQTRPQHLHGINPTLTYLPSGKSFTLPRFCTVEMQTARKMNKLAINNTRTKFSTTFSKASAEDFSRLTSTAIEDTYSRVRWVNPKDGKVYNILKESETNDGKIIIRILDEEGAFIKEATITPKTIVIPDNYNEATRIFGLTHGELTTTYAKRHNPFARYIPIQIDKTKIMQNKELDEVFEYLNNGNTIDYISCSYGTTVEGTKKVLLPDRLRKLSPELFQYDTLADKNIRILCSGTNAEAEMYSKADNLSNNLLLRNSKVEGVGSLNPTTGRISDFSLSRNSELTQHYEIGEFTPTLTRNGINITEELGTDLPFPNKRLEQLAQNPLIGKPAERIRKIQDRINAKLKQLQQEQFQLFSQKLTPQELMARRQKIEQAKHIYSKRKQQLTDLTYGLTIQDGKYTVALENITGTSFSTPIRAAKLALNDMMQGII